MLTYLYLNEIPPNKPTLYKYLSGNCEKNFYLYENYEDLLIIQYIDYYEINFVLKLKEKIPVQDFLGKIGLSNLANSILNNISNNSEYKFLIFNEEDKEIFIKTEGIYLKEIYGKILINTDFIEKLLKIFPKIKVAIIKDIDEEYNFNQLSNRNIFLSKEILYYLSIIKLNIGLLFYLIKYNLKEILNFIQILKLEKITSKNIEIKNNYRNIFHKKTRINKKFHILNISNIDTLHNFTLYKNNLNNKYYIKIHDENLDLDNTIFYNIKNFYILNRKNIIKIKKRYNRSNEILLLYKDKDNTKYILKLTKSIAKNLEKKLQKYNLETFLKEIKENEEKENKNNRTI